MKNKKEIALKGILLLSLVMITVGVSFAFFNYMKEGTKNNSISTGSLTFVYDEKNAAGNGINLINQFPKTDELGKTQTGENNIFDFQIVSTTSGADIFYEIIAEKQSSSTLPENLVKLYLTEVNGEIEKDLILNTYSSLTNTSIIDQTGKTLTKGIVPNKSTNYTKDYRLRMWVTSDAETVTDGEWDYNNMSFSVKINVVANGKEALNTKLMMKSPKSFNADSETLGTAFYAPEYRDNTTSIIIADTVNVPNDAVASWDVSEDQNKSVMAWIAGTSPNYTLTIAGNGGVKASPDSSNMFAYFKNVKTIDVSKLDTSNVTTMRLMFYSCSSLTSLNLAVFNTNNVIDMVSMFYKCSSLTNLDVSNFNTNKVTNMYATFYNCRSLTNLDLSNFDTSNVTDMVSMFEYCSSLTSLDLNSFDTSKVKSMGYMFSKCTLLTSLDLSNFNTSNVTNMSNMFQGCSSLTSLDVSSFDTSKVTTMNSMFNSCSSLTSLDVSSFDTSKVTTMHIMFNNCNSLTSLDLSSFDISKVTSIENMFSGWVSSQTIYVKGTASSNNFSSAPVGWNAGANIAYK